MASRAYPSDSRGCSTTPRLASATASWSSPIFCHASDLPRYSSALPGAPRIALLNLQAFVSTGEGGREGMGNSRSRDV